MSQKKVFWILGTFLTNMKRRFRTFIDDFMLICKFISATQKHLKIIIKHARCILNNWIVKQNNKTLCCVRIASSTLKLCLILLISESVSDFYCFSDGKNIFFSRRKKTRCRLMVIGWQKFQYFWYWHRYSLTPFWAFFWYQPVSFVWIFLTKFLNGFPPLTFPLHFVYSWGIS